jgi:hypothetical protein
MSLKTGTKLRLLAALLLLTSTTLGGRTVPLPAKDAAGCSLESTDGGPGRGGCGDGQGGCYHCFRNDGGDLSECWESADGLTAFCEPEDGGGHQPYVY